MLPTLAGALLPASLDSVLKFLPSSAAGTFTHREGGGGRSSRRHRRSPGPRRLGRCHPWRIRPNDYPSRRLSRLAQLRAAEVSRGCSASTIIGHCRRHAYPRGHREGAAHLVHRADSAVGTALRRAPAHDRRSFLPWNAPLLHREVPRGGMSCRHTVRVIRCRVMARPCERPLPRSRTHHGTGPPLRRDARYKGRAPASAGKSQTAAPSDRSLTKGKARRCGRASFVIVRWCSGGLHLKLRALCRPRHSPGWGG